MAPNVYTKRFYISFWLDVLEKLEMSNAVSEREFRYLYQTYYRRWHGIIDWNLTEVHMAEIHDCYAALETFLAEYATHIFFANQEHLQNWIGYLQ